MNGPASPATAMPRLFTRPSSVAVAPSATMYTERYGKTIW